MLQFEVTQDDINKARKLLGGESNSSPAFRGTASVCPIAIALKRTLKTDKVLVGPWMAIINNRNYQLSKRAEKFIAKFDDKNEAKPARFKLMDYVE